MFPASGPFIQYDNAREQSRFSWKDARTITFNGLSSESREQRIFESAKYLHTFTCIFPWNGLSVYLLFTYIHIHTMLILVILSRFRQLIYQGKNLFPKPRKVLSDPKVVLPSEMWTNCSYKSFSVRQIYGLKAGIPPCKLLDYYASRDMHITVGAFLCKNTNWRE